ncbi:MAG: spore cortex-lytic enzyme [Clostridia bacterium]|nr:spore cortex-lytic enzyme [Clostridia bacterium]
MKDIKKTFGVIALVVIALFLCAMNFAVEIKNLNTATTIETGTLSENKAVQSRLKDLGYYDGPIDGYLGGNTVPAIKAFQRDYGLQVDGIVGKATLSALGVSVGAGQTNSDLYLLAKCVYAEARGEPYTGQVAVAAVILNRVASPDFPNTISGVIYQPWAFTAVNDGQISLEPDQTAYNAARDALNGWDPTYGCLYYYNPTTATSQWIYSRQTVVQIGEHIFAI